MDTHQNVPAMQNPVSANLPWPNSLNSDPVKRQAWVAAGTMPSAGWASTLADCRERLDLAQLLALAEAENEPARLELLLQWGTLLGGLPSQKGAGLEAKAALAIFRMGLEDVPADLLEKAVRTAAKTCTFRPSPAELRALIADDLTERRRRLARLREAVSQNSAAVEAAR